MAHKKLGNNYVYHYNEYTDTWSCIPRDSYIKYWNPNNEKFKDWTEGKSIKDAQEKMLERIK